MQNNSIHIAFLKIIRKRIVFLIFSTSPFLSGPAGLAFHGDRGGLKNTLAYGSLMRNLG